MGSMAKKLWDKDFLLHVNDDCKGFVTTVHEMLLQDNYKPKVQVTKSTGLQLSYSQPKVKGATGVILIFFFRNGKLAIRIYGKNHTAYPNVLNSLPAKIASQIDKAVNCVKFTDPQRCWKGCIGYDFHIGENHYQKCITQCFQFEIDPDEDVPHLLELIKNENKARIATEA